MGLQEAKDSSAIENIITTHDELYKSELNHESFKSLDAKEVQNYISALKIGFELVKTDNMGNAKASFYNADVGGKMMIVVEAISENGNIG